MTAIEQWINDNGDNTHRLNYNLNNNSIVFDLGGYIGWFTEQINNKYGSKIYCFEPIKEFYVELQNKFIANKNIFVFQLAISDENKKEIIYVNNDASSIFQKTGQPVEIDCVTLDKVMLDNNINYIDLIKINIEGAEYSLLEYMIKNDLIKKCNNIQVQFHNFIEHYDLRHDYIRYELEKTHYLTYNYPFVWENWTKK
jgi:FkbM family methyltransferase